MGILVKSLISQYYINQKTFAVNQIARFTSKPRLEHWTALKRVLRYLQGTRGHGLLFRRSAVQKALRIDGYADADWAGDANTRKSTGFIFTAAGAAISWRSQPQRCVALSTAEAELIALTESVKEAAWLAKLATDLKIEARPLAIHEDNQAAIALSRDVKFSEKTKHMAVRWFYVTEMASNGVVKITYVATAEQLSDFLTKAQGPTQFVVSRHRIGVVEIINFTKKAHAV